jgi:heat shock protein HslJ
MRTLCGVLAIAALATACANRLADPGGSPPPGRSTQPVLSLTPPAASRRPPAEKPLIGVSWQGEEHYVTLAFTENTVRINDGCNNELMQVSIDDQTLDIGTTVGPTSTCTGRMVDQEPPDVAPFDRVTSSSHLSWQVTGDALRLTDPRGDTIQLHAAGPALNVTGQEWSLKYYVDTGSYEHDGHSAARLRIDDGTVHASDLGNELTGRATVSDFTIDFTDIHTTAQACQDPTSDSETEVIDHVLSGSVSYQIITDRLIVSNNGRGQLIYTPSQ